MEPEEEEEVNLCTYVFIDSRDQLLLNFSPPAIDVIMEVSEVKSDCRSINATLSGVAVGGLWGEVTYVEKDLG